MMVSPPPAAAALQPRSPALEIATHLPPAFDMEAGSSSTSPPGAFELPVPSPLSPFPQNPFLTEPSDSLPHEQQERNEQQPDSGPSLPESLSALPLPGIHLGSFSSIKPADFDQPRERASPTSPPSHRSPSSPSARSFTPASPPESERMPSPRDSAAVSRRKTVGASVVAASNYHHLRAAEAGQQGGGEVMRGLGIIDVEEAAETEAREMGRLTTDERRRAPSPSGSGSRGGGAGLALPDGNSTFGSKGRQQQRSLPDPSTEGSRSRSSGRSRSWECTPASLVPPHSPTRGGGALQPTRSASNATTRTTTSSSSFPPLPKPPPMIPSADSSTATPPTPLMPTASSSLSPGASGRPRTPQNGEGESTNRAGVGSREMFSPSREMFSASRDSFSAPKPPGGGGTRPSHKQGDPSYSSLKGAGGASPSPAKSPTVRRALPHPPPTPSDPYQSQQQQLQQSPIMRDADEPPSGPSTSTRDQQRRGQRESLSTYVPGVANALGPYPTVGSGPVRRSLEPWAQTVPLGMPGLPVAGPGGEICIECMTRDNDLINVDVTSPGVWARRSDADVEDLAQREADGEDITDSLEGGRSWEGGGPVGMGMVPGLEGSLRRTLKGHRLTEEALKEWTLKNPPASTHRFQTLQVYLLGQSRLISAEASARAAAQGTTASLESRIHATKIRETFAPAPVRRDPEASRLRQQQQQHQQSQQLAQQQQQVPQRTLGSSQMSLEGSAAVERQRSATGYSGGPSMSPRMPAPLAQQQQQQPSQQPAALHHPPRSATVPGGVQTGGANMQQPSQRISSASTLFGPPPDLAQLRLTASYSALEPPVSSSAREPRISSPSGGQVVRPFSFAVWAGGGGDGGRGRSASAGGGVGANANGGGSEHGGRGGFFRGRWGGGGGSSQASHGTGRRSFWGGSGSMMDMHVGLERDREREMRLHSAPYQPGPASADELRWQQPDLYSLAGSSTLQSEFPPGSGSLPASPTRGMGSAGNRQSRVEPVASPKKKKKGLKAFFSKLGGGSVKSNSSFGNSPQVYQQNTFGTADHNPNDDDLDSPLPPPPSLGYLARSGTGGNHRSGTTSPGNGGGPNSTRESSHSPSSSWSASSVISIPGLNPPPLSTGPSFASTQHPRSVSSPVGHAALPPQGGGPGSGGSSHLKAGSLSSASMLFRSGSPPLISPTSLRFPARRGSRDTMGSRKSGLGPDGASERDRDRERERELQSQSQYASYGPASGGSMTSSPGELPPGAGRPLGDGLTDMGLVQEGSATPTPVTPAEGADGGEQQRRLPRPTSQVFHTVTGARNPQGSYPPMGGATMGPPQLGRLSSSIVGSGSGGDVYAQPSQRPQNQQAQHRLSANMSKDLPPLPPVEFGGHHPNQLPPHEQQQQRASTYQPNGVVVHYPAHYQHPPQQQQQQQHQNSRTFTNGQQFTYSPGNSAPNMSLTDPFTEHLPPSQAQQARLMSQQPRASSSMSLASGRNKKKEPKTKLSDFFGSGGIGRKNHSSSGGVGAFGSSSNLDPEARRSSDLQAITQAITRDDEFIAYRYPSQEIVHGGSLGGGGRQ